MLAAARANAPSTAERARVLVVGDSLAAEYGLARGSGWVALLAQRLASHQPPYEVVNASISGETTAGGASRIDDLIARHSPAIVVIELGGNDALRGLDLEQTRGNLSRMAKAARSSGAKVLVAGMQVPPNYGRAYTEAFAALFERVARDNDAALLPFLLESIAQDRQYFQPDQIHPTQAAQPLILETVWSALQPLL